MNKPKTLIGDCFFSSQYGKWESLRESHNILKHIKTRNLIIDNNTITIQFNPRRTVSTCASVDKHSIEQRPCFLCMSNKPAEQDFIRFSINEPFILRVNPYPILPKHLTISSEKHQPQLLADKTHLQIPGLLITWLEQHFEKGYALFYNGAVCGASAPDHFHFQAVLQTDVPFIRQWDRLMQSAIKIQEKKLPDKSICTEYEISNYLCPIRAFITNQSYITDSTLITQYLDSLPLHENENEPRYNLFAWIDPNRGFSTAYFPRKKHRPDCYSDEGSKKHLISPGALDMGGLIVTIRQEDFESISKNDIIQILNEVSYKSAFM